MNFEFGSSQVNVVVRASDWRPSDLPLLFGDEPVHFTDVKDLPNLLVELRVFRCSKG